MSARDWRIRKGRIYTWARQRTVLTKLLRSGGNQTFLLLFLLCLLAAVPSLTAVVTGFLAKRLSDILYGTVAVESVTVAVVGVVAVLVVEQLVMVLRAATEFTVAQRIDTYLRSRVRACFLRAPLALAEDPSFADDASRAGDLASVNGFVRSPGRAACAQIALALRFVSAVLAALVVAGFSVWLAAALLVVAVVTRDIQRRRWKVQMDMRDTVDGFRRRAGYWTDTALDAGAGKEIRLFALPAWISARRREEMWNWLGDLTRVRRWVLSLEWWMVLPRGLIAGAALFVPGMAVVNGDLAVSGLVRTVVASFGVLAAGNLGSETFMIDYGLQAVHALQRIEDRAGGPQVLDAPLPAERCPVPARIELRHISFGYPRAAERVVDEFDLTIEPRESLAVVGRNGIGKTTLIKLIAGLYTPQSGEIRVDGVALTPDSTPDWQRRVAVVFQNFVRYPLTAAQNIALGAPEHQADHEGIRNAAERAGLTSFLDRLPHGLDTVLSRELRDGADLSGGQWQKLAIARALFAVDHGRDLLILDEPTAHLDVRAEAEFYERIVAEIADRATVVLISHRLSTVRAADRIVVLDETGIAEEGDHDTLMTEKGKYAHMFALQAARFAEEPVDPSTALDGTSATAIPGLT